MGSIVDFYHNQCDESERLNSQAGKVEYFTTMYYLKKYCHQGTRVLDACAGGGIYSFPLAEMGCEVIAGDLVDVNVNYIRNVDANNPILKEIYQGDILDLSRFESESFDVVLNLGAYYHMCDKEQRLAAIRESNRVLKKDGVYFMSYINRYANYMAHCNEMNIDFGFFERYMKNGHIDDEYIFYASTPEETEKELQELDITPLHNVGVDGPTFVYKDVVDKMEIEDFERFLKIHLKQCEVRSNLGISEHGLIVFKK